VHPQSTQMLSLCCFVQGINTKWIRVLMGTLEICIFFDTFKDFHNNAVFLSFGYKTHHFLNAHIPATWSSSRRLSSWSPSFTRSFIPFYCLSYSAKDKVRSTKVTANKQLKEKKYILARIWKQLYYRSHWVCPAENRSLYENNTGKIIKI